MLTHGTFHTFLVQSMLILIGILMAVKFWSARETKIIEHNHDDFNLGHSHKKGLRQCSQAIIIDNLHPKKADSLLSNNLID
jgi:hypothetical protein